MNHAKTIKLFLLDGDPNGRMSCEISNWSGKAYKIPRIKIKDCNDRSDLSGTGVYLLFGKDETGKEQVYIGEAESILKRLNQQLIQKDFWNEAIVFISKDENLNKAHIKYLENRLHEIATKAKRYVLENSLITTRSSISESDRAEMEEFIDYIKILVNTLGHKVFQEKRDQEATAKKNIFFIKAARGAEAEGETNSDGFLVFKGSKIATTTVKSLTSGLVNYRQKLLIEGVITQNDETLEFSDDYIFSSPSTAASIVLGRNANGLTEWKDKKGKTLKEFEGSEK
jgi:hypothetical protein